MAIVPPGYTGGGAAGLLRDPQGRVVHVFRGNADEATDAARAAGYDIPENQHLSMTGYPVDDGSWLTPLLLAGAGFGGAFALPALLGGGAAAAGGAGTAAGAGAGTGAGVGAGTAAAAGAGAGGSILGKIGSGIKNSFLNDPLGALGSLGTVLSGGAAGSANQRMNEANAMVGMGRLANDQARDTFSAGLAGAQFQREGQDRERKAQMLMALLNGMQDLRLTPGNPKIAAAMGNVSGGARPSALTANKDALLAQLAQPQVDAPTYTPAQLPTMPTAGIGEKLMGGIGLGGTILGTLGALGGGKKPPVEDPMKKYADLGYATGY